MPIRTVISLSSDLGRDQKRRSGNTYLVPGTTFDMIERRIEDGDGCAREGCSVNEGSAVVDDIFLQDRRRKNHGYGDN